MYGLKGKYGLTTFLHESDGLNGILKLTLILLALRTICDDSSAMDSDGTQLKM